MAGTGGASAPAPQRRERRQGMARQRREQTAGTSTWGPPGRQQGEARHHTCLSALPSRRGSQHRLAAQPCAGAVQRRRCFSRYTDWSAGGCADRCPCSTTRAQACSGWTPRRHRLGGVCNGAAVDDGGVGRMARSTKRPYRSQPWAQQREANGGQVRDGTDDSADVPGTKVPCAELQVHGGEGDAGRGSTRRAWG
jgi:hypothetical protein